MKFFGHQHFHAVHEFFRRPRVPRNNLVFLDEVDLNVQFVERDPVFGIPVQPVRLLRQDRSARCMVFRQIGEHLVEMGSTSCLGGFDVFELLHNCKTVANGILAQKAKLGRNAEALLS